MVLSIWFNVPGRPVEHGTSEESTRRNSHEIPLLGWFEWRVTRSLFAPLPEDVKGGKDAARVFEAA